MSRPQPVRWYRAHSMEGLGSIGFIVLLPVGKECIVGIRGEPLDTLSTGEEQRNAIATADLGECDHSTVGVNVNLLVRNAFVRQVSFGLLAVATPCCRVQNNRLCWFVCRR